MYLVKVSGADGETGDFGKVAGGALVVAGGAFGKIATGSVGIIGFLMMGMLNGGDRKG